MAGSKLTNEDQLKRMIYLGSTDCRYTAGNLEKHSSWISSSCQTVLEDFAENDPKKVIDLISAASEDKNLPRRTQLYHILARLLHHESLPENLKHEVTETVLKIQKFDEEFFDFVQWCSKMRSNRSVKLAPSVKKTVAKFYKSKTPLQLANSYARFNRYHKWSHKDLIKLAHLKSDTPLKNVVVNYILFKKTNDKENEEEKKLIEILKKSQELRSTKEHVDAVPIISQLKASISQVCPDLHHSQQVWAAVLENMSIQEILPWLLKLYKLGFLKANTPTQANVLAALTNSEKIKASGVHPIEVFIGMKNFEKGGRPMDPKLVEHLEKEKNLTEEDLRKVKTRHESKCPVILNNLQKCMSLACQNLTATNKRYLITIDVTEKSANAPCVANKAISSLEAAVAYTTVMLKTEKDVMVATYNDKDIKIINLEKKGSFSDHMETIRSHKSGYAQMFAPIEWATSEKKHIDVFINFIHHEYLTSVPKEDRPKFGTETLVKYRKKVNLPNAKLVTFCLSSPRLVVSGSNSNTVNALDVVGFDIGGCRAVEAFCRGSFS